MLKIQNAPRQKKIRDQIQRMKVLEVEDYEERQK